MVVSNENLLEKNGLHTAVILFIALCTHLSGGDG